MKRWTRARIARRCGRCGALVAAGDPILELAIASVRSVLLRCVACEGPAPADLPAPAERTPAPANALPFARFSPGLLPLDWKTAAAGAREPGEDG